MNLKKDKNKKYKLIAVSDENYISLEKIGTFGQSFNDVITDLLKKYPLQYDSTHIVNIH
ncbi:MAG TPA: hypothetical protein VK250_02150 [Nitrososphaeraceae archaeon]|nr:hypothetical protein [Nitrososphaeraceae archaeon]